MKKVLFLQYFNPGAYPPLEHASAMMAERGWQVSLLGVALPEVKSLAMAPLGRRRMRLLPYFGSGAALRLNYLIYVAWAALVCLSGGRP